jgi:hypothetical protein
MKFIKKFILKLYGFSQIHFFSVMKLTANADNNTKKKPALINGVVEQVYAVTVMCIYTSSCIRIKLLKFDIYKPSFDPRNIINDYRQNSFYFFLLSLNLSS